ncbi:hypothetical protein [Neotamlana nanhaiensis]|uniref:hypothetical protein n=1 Tax=Neotamlana nanhaiensis TaxID=1382798 RepID=UPI000B19258A|nr:hypothetical protein [Tamlana nanhaiensis]
MAKPIYNLSYLMYYQVNIDYIIENYCVNKDKVEMACNGKCHLAKQLQKNDTKDEKNNGVKLFSELFSVVFYQNQSSFNLLSVVLFKAKKNQSFYVRNYGYAYNSSLLKPPIV